MKDAYQTLGVARDADKESIKLAYYALRKQFAALRKPTRAQTERLVKINSAWDILKIPERKADYDTELARAAKAKRERDEAAARKRERDAASPPSPPPPPPPPEPEAASDPVEKETPVYHQAWRPDIPRPRQSKRVSPAVWKLGTAVGALYILGSLMKPTAPAPTPAVEVKAEAPATKASSKAARRKGKRKTTIAQGKAPQRSRDSQDTAELNRRELDRVKAASARRYREAPPLSRPENDY